MQVAQNEKTNGPAPVADIRTQMQVRLRRNADGEPLCEDCGSVLGEKDYTRCAGCNDKLSEAIEREANERRRRNVTDIASRGFRVTAPRIDWARLGDPTLLKILEGRPKLQEAAENWHPKDGNLAALGLTGTGKTVAVRATLHRLICVAIKEAMAADENAGTPALVQIMGGLHWTTAHALANARRQHGLGEGEAEPIERALGASLLVIDELGFEPQHDSALFEIVDHHYIRGNSIVVTSGLRPAEIASRYGDAFWRRIAERGTVVQEWGKAGG